MTTPPAVPNMRAVNRRVAAWFSLVLIILQMVMGPIAHPMPDCSGPNGRDPATMGATQHADDQCANCPSDDDRAPGRSHHGHPAPLGHARCTCPCAHTPALALPALSLAQRDLAEGIPAEVRGPAFSPPLFDFLRPPN